MKKLLATISLVLILAMACAPMAFASGLEVTGITPADGKGGLQNTNIAVKVKFNEDVSSEANDAVNQAKFVLKSSPDADGKVTEYSYAAGNVKVVHSDKYPNELWYILDATIEPNSQYTVELLPGVKATSGNTLDKAFTSTFKTRNAKTDGLISTFMMVGMMVVMVMATSKAAKAAAGEAADPKAVAAQKKTIELNPYKLAKEKNISLDEAKAIVEKEKAKIEKERAKAEAEAARKEAARQAEIEAMEAKLEAELEAQRKACLYHVKGPKSITATGREVPKAVTKQKKHSAAVKAAKIATAEKERELNSKGKKSKK
ncbi:MAG: Ig-like domain-containing protein [Clostridia bacterium]|nr:Ig-like domain-containing protein [Clostridia bacterium]